jgi:putative ABC transport system permease protein
LQDFRYALRLVRSAPAFTLSCVVTLALGIGVNTAIFSAINAILLRPLPYRDANRLVAISEEKFWIPYPDYVDFRTKNTSFDDIAAYTPQGQNPVVLSTNGTPEQVQGSLVTANLLPLLGVQPAAGKNFLSSEAQPGHDQVAILGNSLWLRRFGGSSHVVGQFIEIDAKSFRVAGVLPRGVQFPLTADVLMPVSRLSDFERTSRKHHILVSIGRLKPNVSFSRAEADLRNISLLLQQLYPATNKTISSSVVPLNEQLVGDVRTPLLVLLTAVGLILVIACSNVASLLLASAATRRREIALRVALGASRLRVVQQLLLESSILSFLGGLLGLLFAAVAVPGMRVLAEFEVPRANEITLDPFVLAVALTLSIATGILFGLPPAIEALRQSQNQALRASGRGMSGEGRRKDFRRALVIAEVSLAIIVLNGAGLLVRSFSKLLATDPGIHTGHILTFTVPLSGTNYEKQEQVQRFFDQLLPRLAALPTVDGLANVDPIPFAAPTGQTRFAVAGQPPPEAGKFLVAHMRFVSPSYFALLHMPLQEGRQFRDADLASNAAPAVIVNRAFAQRFLSDGPPLGRGIILGVVDPKQRVSPVVGVVGDVRDENLALSAKPTLYFPALGTGFLLRTTDDPVKLVSAIQREVRAIDPTQPVADIHTLNSIVSESLARRRFSAILLAGFSGLALLLAAIGLYGLISYSVTQRTQEIGIRMALGSTRQSVFGMVVRESLSLTAAGLTLGFLAALPTTRLLADLLYGITSGDPLTVCVVTSLLAVVGTIAALFPARRAVAVDPMVALRWE